MKKVIIMFLAVLCFTTIGCKDDETTIEKDDGTTGSISADKKKGVLDKIWYPTNAGGGVNFEFITNNNVFRVNKSLDGTWKWQNNGDTMNIVDYTGARYNLLFTNVSAHNITYTTNDGGDGYQTEFKMKDTE